MDNKLKVVQLSSVHPAFDTRIFFKICTSLKNAGCSVDLIIQHKNDEVVNGINIYSLPIAQKKLDRPLKVIPKLFLKCIAYGKDTIFHFHDPELIPVGLLLKVFGYKVIYDVHENVPKDVLSKDWLPVKLRALISKWIDRLEQYCVSKFDAVIVVTPEIKSRLDSQRTIMVQNFPIVQEKINEVSKSSKDYLFYIGDITLIRGIKEMINSLYIVNKKKDHPIRLKLGGKFSPESLHAKMKNEKGWEYVDFIGWLSREELKKIAENAIAGFVLFHPVPSHINAQPNKLFEYMLEELPVIASDFPLWERFINDNKSGILVNPNNTEEIADAVIKLIENPDEAKKMGKNGRSAILSKYNWKSEEEKLLRLYRSLNKCEVNN
ncbi:MAG: glycosyltransferase family 4 protein [Balneola sp.]